jgi:hypothetical protein
MRTIMCGVVALVLATQAWAGAVRGKLVLKDASNDDVEVGASPRDGIPQGHVLKVVVQGVRVRGRPAAEAEVEVSIRKGSEVVADGEGDLNKQGYGEVLMPISETWLGVYHVDVRIDATSGLGGLEAEFRVVEAEPDPDMPEGIIAVFVLLGLGMTVLWWKKSRPASA